MALILVTGASTGLGLAAATTLAGEGHDVVLHARNPDRLADQPVLEHVYDVVYGDLSDLDETVRVAEEANSIGRFDAVIHNAGAMHGPSVVAVNTIAPFALTAVMTPPERSVFLSSSMHMSGSTDLSAKLFTDARNRRTTYEDSKLYVTAFALAVAARRPDVMAHAVDPGWVPTRMGGPGASDDFDEGHRTQEWLATADETAINPRSGGYWYHRATRQPHPATHDAQFQDELLRLLEAHTGIEFPS